MTSTQRLRTGWLLWSDWCEAVGHFSLTVTADQLEAYARSVSRPNLGDVRSTCREVGLAWPWDSPGGASDPRAGYEDTLAPLAVALSRCETRGWPAGLRGRRDAWLLVLTRAMKLTRREALAVRAHDVKGMIAQFPERQPGDSSASCWRCVATRWIGVVNLNDDWSWRSVRQLLLSPRPEVVRGHVCDEIPAVNPHLDASALAPSIDIHGGTVPGRTISTRALTHVIGSRSARSWTPRVVVETGDRAQPEFGDVDMDAARAFDETTLDRLEVAMDAADEANVKIERLLADTSRILTGK